MTRHRTIGDLFKERPAQWALRGDPHLWGELHARLEEVPMPDSVDVLIAILENEFALLTGHSITETADLYIDRYDHGGMSGGHLSPEYWRSQILPLLRERYEEP